MSGTATASANLATITLPAGYTFEQYEFLEGQAVAIAIVTSVVTGIVCWDYFVLLPDEISLYRSLGSDNRLWRAPTTYLFIILRYSTLIAFIPALFFSAAQSSHCQVAAGLSQAGVALVVMSSGGIFCFRIFAMWRENRIVQTVITLLYLLMVSCWIAVATTYHATAGPATPFASNCVLASIPDWNTISFASSLAFDAVVLLLTLAKLRPSLQTARSAVGRRLIQDTVMYFLITTCVNIAVMAIESLRDPTTLIKPATIPFSTLFTAVIGSRVFLNLKLMETRRRKELNGIPLSASGLSSEAATRGTMSAHIGAYTQDDVQNSTYISTAYPPTSTDEYEQKNASLTPESHGQSFTLSPSSRAETLPYSKHYQ